MKTIIEALQSLYVAMGGQAADVADLTVTPDMIDAIADVYEGGGGSSLPAVTAADNSKLLTVVNGAWDKADAPKELPSPVGASNEGKVLAIHEHEWVKKDISTLTATFTGTPDPEHPTDLDAITWTCDKTNADLLAALASGKPIQAHGSIVGMDIDTFLTTYAKNSQTNEISFTGIGWLGGYPVYLSVGFDDSIAFGMIVPLAVID